MNELNIYYFRENNGEGEYVVFSEENYSKEQMEEFLLLGYTFEQKISCTTNDQTYKLPFEVNMIKQR